MRSRIGRFILLLLLFGSVRAECAWSLVQHTTTGGVAGTDPITKAYGSNVTSGNLLVFVYTWGLGTGTATFSASAGTATIGSIATADTANDGTNGQSISIGSALVTASGSLTIQGTASAGTGFSDLEIQEWSGNAASSVLDVHNNKLQTSTTPSLAVTTTADGDVVIASIIDTQGGSVTFTKGSTLTEIDNHGNSGNVWEQEYIVQGTHGSQTADWSHSANQATAMVIAAFKPVSGAAACKPSLASTGAGACH